MTFFDFIPAIVVALLFVFANSMAMKSLEPGHEWFVWISASIGFGAFCGFRYVCQQYGLAIASGIVDSTLTILTVLVGIFLFQETLTLRQYLGLGLIISGLVLVR
jgi:drug/metabolite transporter (DMT)-like permease